MSSAYVAVQTLLRRWCYCARTSGIWHCQYRCYQDQVININHCQYRTQPPIFVISQLTTADVTSRAESKVPCTRERYVSDLGYVSKTQTRIHICRRFRSNSVSSSLLLCSSNHLYIYICVSWILQLDHVTWNNKLHDCTSNISCSHSTSLSYFHEQILV